AVVAGGALWYPALGRALPAGTPPPTAASAFRPQPGQKVALSAICVPQIEQNAITPSLDIAIDGYTAPILHWPGVAITRNLLPTIWLCADNSRVPWRRSKQKLACLKGGPELGLVISALAIIAPDYTMPLYKRCCLRTPKAEEACSEKIHRFSAHLYRQSCSFSSPFFLRLLRRTEGRDVYRCATRSRHHLRRAADVRPGEEAEHQS